MTARLLRTWPSELLLLPLVVIFFAYVDIHFYYRSVIAFPAVYLFLLTLGGVAGIVVVRGTLSAPFRTRVIALYAAHVPVILALGSIVFFSLLLSFLPGAYWAEGPRYVVFPAYDALTVVLAMMLPLVDQPPRLRRHLALAFLAFAASVLADAVHPGTFSLLAERAAGFAENPNTASFLLIAFCCSVLRFDGVRLPEIAVLALASAGVLATLSRGGGVLLAFLLLCYAYGVLWPQHGRGRGRWRGVLALALLAAAIYGATAVLLRRSEMFTLPGQTRVDLLRGDQEFVSSEDTRYTLLSDAVQLVREAPLLGHGSGFTWSLPDGPHNMYLQQWVNNGLPGVASYLWLLLAAALTFRKRRYRPGLVFVGAVAIEGLFSHNLLDERAFLAFLGVLLTLSYDAAARRRRVVRADARVAGGVAGRPGSPGVHTAPGPRVRATSQG